jgi:serine/threonine protein kinase
VSSHNKQLNSGNLVSSGEEGSLERSDSSGQGETIDPLIGRTIGKHYQILACRGKGGMSTVYKAKDLSMGRFVAIKFLLSEGKTARDQMMLRFQREGRVVGSLDHPNIISVHAFDFTADRQPFLVMDYVEGETLAERIVREGMLPLATSLDIFIQICDGLAQAHEKGILHRDLKPGNIMLISENCGGVTLKILDFGIAKLVENSASTTQQLTRTGDVFGSPLYMSPEQGLGKSLTTSSDLYSLGCLMYETLTGVPPFMGKTAVETILKHQTESPATLKEATLGTEFPDKVQSIVSTLLSKEPGDRIQSAQELGMALRSLKESDMQPNMVIQDRTPVASTKCERSLPVMAATALIALVSTVFLIGSTTFRKQAVENVTPTSNENIPAAQIIRNLPKLTQEELDDSKVAFDAKYTPNATTGDYADYKLSARGFSELQKMKKLNALDLSRTSADDSAMKIVGGLQNLSYLILASTKVTDEGVKAIAKVSPTTLNLGHTNISNTALDTLKNMDQLAELYLEGTQIDDQCMPALIHLKNLNRLDLSETKITDQALLSLSELPNLEELRLVKTNISDTGLSYLKNLRNLTVLDVEHTAVTDLGLSNLVSLRKLKSLSLSNTRITNAGLSTLPHLPSLRKLELNHTQISDQGLPLLLKLNNPTYLGLQGCGGLSKQGLAKLKTAFPGCQISTVPSMEKDIAKQSLTQSRDQILDGFKEAITKEAITADPH